MKINLFVVGTPKSGTTSLYNAFENCEEVSLPMIKEPNYFTREEIKSEIKNGISDAAVIKKIQRKHIGLIETKELYLSNYEKKSVYNCDFSTSYSRYHEKTALRIHDYNPQAKIIIMIREPLGRIISHYNMDKRIGYIKKDLNTTLENELKGIGKTNYFKDSDYKNIVKTYKRYFNDVLIISFEERIVCNHQILRKELEDFLNVSLVNFNITKENEANEARFANLNYILSRMGVKKIIRDYGSKRLKYILKSKFYKKIKRIDYDLSEHVYERLENLKNEYLEFIK